MKIYDCFTYFDEDLILDTRLNIMDDHVDYFVIVESTYNHNGERRELKFDINKYKKFKNKIKYIVWDEVPENIEKINDNDTEIVREHKFINNAVKRDNGQRNYVVKGLDDAEDNDLILLSDLDEIPSLKTIDLKNIKTKIIIFDQIMCYYKFNLAIPNYKWFGTRACLKKDLKSPQWLRNIKARKYSFYRLDILLNEKKFNNIQLIKNGGWHFTNIKTPEEVFPFEKSTHVKVNPHDSQEVVLMMGFPGSGKTTYTKYFDHFDNYVVLHGDDLKTEAKIKRELIKELEKGKSVVIDATHASVKKRDVFLTIAKKKELYILEKQKKEKNTRPRD